MSVRILIGECRERLRELPEGSVHCVVKANVASRIGRKRAVGDPERRNLRNIWTISTQSFPEAHFATMAPRLAEVCIKAGCPEGGTALDHAPRRGDARAEAQVAEDVVGNRGALIGEPADVVLVHPDGVGSGEVGPEKAEPVQMRGQGLFVLFQPENRLRLRFRQVSM